MKIADIQKSCVGCTACATVCPVKCISIESSIEGFYNPILNRAQCIQCGKCEKVCPCLNEHNMGEERSAYWGQSTKDEILKSSSSGGIFRHLADVVLGDAGVVYGAIFDQNTRSVKHSSTDKVPIEHLQKSKYVESYLGNTFHEIHEHLTKGRKVLFCGTPCQVAGLKNMITDPHGLLITCDFICHGVPSAKLFQEHLQYLFHDEKILNVDFRSKDKGWGSEYKMHIETNSQTRVFPYYLDSFFAGFMKYNAFLRESCYDCHFRERHCSDITIADFWGYKKYDPTIDFKKGISLIVTNSKKGEEILTRIDSFNLNPMDFKFAEYAYASRDLSQAKAMRKQFFDLYIKIGLEKSAKKLYLRGRDFRKAKVKYYIKKIIERK